MITKRIFLTSGTSWTVPADWNSASNRIYVIGRGGAGGGNAGTNTVAGGGAGGQFARKNNLSLTPTTSVSYQLGGVGADTWFQATTTVLAKAGAAGSGTTAGTGSSTGAVGDVVRAGGSGAAGASGGGGGGAAGPDAAGSSSTSTTGGAGNGGLNGGGTGGGTQAGTGGSGTTWSSTHLSDGTTPSVITAGPGGGAGGRTNNGVGGTGGAYGGGGGGARSNNAGGAGGSPLIVIEWDVLESFTLTAATTSYTYTGLSANLTRTWSALVGAKGTYTQTGIAAGFSRTAAALSLIAAVGSYTLTGVAAKFQRPLGPDSDISIETWTTQSGATTGLYDQINEFVPDDNDYIKTPSMTGQTANAVFAIANLLDPQTSADHKVEYRYRKQGNATSALTVQLVQGTTVIAQWTHTGISTDWVTVTQTLSALEADSITDYNDLRFKFVGVVS